ncbi:MAG TPA: tetratricopeptide repeat protein [Gallionella sp.]
MSLLFDALKRAQGDDAKQAELQMPDASQRLYSGSNEAPPLDASSRLSSGNHEAPPADARTISAVTSKPKSNALPYTVAGLVLLAGVAAWFFYQINQYAPVTPLHPVPMMEVALVAQPPAASQPAAASGIAQTGTAGTASGTDTSVNKAWTHPAASKSHKKRKSVKKPARHDIMVSADHDPLKEGYLALSQGRLDLAEQKYLEVLAKHPHEKDALLGLAVVAHRKLQIDRAASLYRQVLREDMGNAAAAAGLVSLSAQADPVAAESQLRELLDIKPAAPELHYALGSVLARQLRWGEAQQAFFRAYSLQPGNALYAYNLAVSLDRLHQPSAALPYYEKAAQLAKPGDPTLDMNAIELRIQQLSKADAR